MRTTPNPATTAARATEGLRLTGCPKPGCGLPTEIYDEIELASTDGPIVHVRTVCVGGHCLFLPMERLMV